MDAYGPSKSLVGTASTPEGSRTLIPMGVVFETTAYTIPPQVLGAVAGTRTPSMSLWKSDGLPVAQLRHIYIFTHQTLFSDLTQYPCL